MWWMLTCAITKPPRHIKDKPIDTTNCKVVSTHMPDFFERFGSVSHEKTYPLATPTEAIAIDIAERWEEETLPGHGMFFDFSQTPELEKPVLDYLTQIMQ
jgi:hypothetical protein